LSLVTIYIIPDTVAKPVKDIKGMMIITQTMLINTNKRKKQFSQSECANSSESIFSTIYMTPRMGLTYKVYERDFFLVD